MGKLIELMIAADIKWPAGAKFAAQSKHRAVTFSTNHPSCLNGRETWDCYGGAIERSEELRELVPDWNTFVITVKDYYLAGGWIDFKYFTISSSVESGHHEVLYKDGFRAPGNLDKIDWNNVAYYRLIGSKPIPVVGDIPVVGQECEIHHVNWSKNEWRHVSVLAVTNTYLIVKHGDDGFEQHYHLRDMSFRPLRTEREKAIECLVTILKRFDCSPHEIAEALLDAGYHK